MPRHHINIQGIFLKLEWNFSVHLTLGDTGRVSLYIHAETKRRQRQRSLHPYTHIAVFLLPTILAITMAGSIQTGKEKDAFIPR
jgi:hypothetical protein